MMPVHSRRQGDDLLVDSVDLKRAARTLLNRLRAPGWTPPRDLNQAMELMASCFGYANLLAANKQAQQAPAPMDLWAGRRGDSVVITPRMLTSRRDGRQMSHIGMRMEDLIARTGALAAAAPETARAAIDNATTNLVLTPSPSSVWSPAPDTFPADCGARFDQRWKTLASAAFYCSLAGVEHSGDIVAIIGGPGVGKSLLVKAMAKSMEGAIIDFRLKTWQEDFDRVRRAPPSLVVIEEMYDHSEATEMQVAAFALAAKSTKTVFVFQNYETLVRSLLSRRDPSGKPLFTLARVLDLDRMTLNTVYAEDPMAIDHWHQDVAQTAKTSKSGGPRQFEDALRESLSNGRHIPVIVAAEDISVQSIMKWANFDGAIRSPFIFSCAENTVELLSHFKRRDPDLIVLDHADKATSEFLCAQVTEAINTGHPVCLRVSDPHWKGPIGLDLGRRFQFSAEGLGDIGDGRLADEN